MRVLIACEFSGIVRDAFAAHGHDAWSCDLEPNERPGQHIQGDVRSILDQHWDLMVAHPPCQYLARSGAWTWKRIGRQEKQADALNFVRLLLHQPIARICIENPPGRIGTAIGPATQYVQPWEHGHGEVKMTGLWLRNLPRLRPTNIVAGREERILNMSSVDRSKNRSRTYPGIASAMAAQWSDLPPWPQLALFANGEHT